LEKNSETKLEIGGKGEIALVGLTCGNAESEGGKGDLTRNAIQTEEMGKGGIHGRGKLRRKKTLTNCAIYK